MRKKKKTLTLYNAFFPPIWLLWVFLPPAWVIVLPANYILDVLVLVLGMKICHVEDMGQQLKKTMVKTWLLGFAADFLGSIPLLVVGWRYLWPWDVSEAGELEEKLYEAVWYQPFESVWSFLIVTLGFLIAIVCIFAFNYFIAFKKTELTQGQKKKTALILAVVTAPWTFYFPIELYYIIDRILCLFP
ncbi:MAG: hypothetical protein J1F02_05395 [Lachnospiraceae bacterium]|nr:hypothetical protein [Lachnospiraceae bacterium]